MDIWLFECLQPDFATFDYGGLGISLKIKLLVSGERISTCCDGLLGRVKPLLSYVVERSTRFW